jgi:hypothetical protein
MLARSVMSVVSVPVQSIRLGIRKDDGGPMPKALSHGGGPESVTVTQLIGKP